MHWDLEACAWSFSLGVPPGLVGSKLTTGIPGGGGDGALQVIFLVMKRPR